MRRVRGEGEQFVEQKDSILGWREEREPSGGWLNNNIVWLQRCTTLILIPLQRRTRSGMLVIAADTTLCSCDSKQPIKDGKRSSTALHTKWNQQLTCKHHLIYSKCMHVCTLESVSNDEEASCEPVGNKKGLDLEWYDTTLAGEHTHTQKRATMFILNCHTYIRTNTKAPMMTSREMGLPRNVSKCPQNGLRSPQGLASPSECLKTKWLGKTAQQPQWSI